MLSEHSLKPEEKFSLFRNTRPICVDGALYVSIRRAFVGNFNCHFFFGVLQIPHGGPTDLNKNTTVGLVKDN